jgi:DNA-binding MarR family transcriptional regulator
MRDDYFGRGLFADPAWDILLDLFAARLEQRKVSVSKSCYAAGIPQTTALRWIGALVDRGLVVRQADGRDRRRFNICLSDQAAAQLSAYFDRARADVAGPVL